MLLRSCYLLSMAVLLAAHSGCCGLSSCPLDWGPGGSPCDRTWCCSSCGPRVWNEWFSFPPLCRDNCTCCGEFTASNNPYVLNGPTVARFGPIYDDGSGRGRGDNAPTPAQRPTPAEELPPAEPTTSVDHDQFGHTVSYREPREPRARQGGRSMAGHHGEDYDAGYDEPFDSPRPSRKLGKPSRPPRYAR